MQLYAFQLFETMDRYKKRPVLLVCFLLKTPVELGPSIRINGKSQTTFTRICWIFAVDLLDDRLNRKSPANPVCGQQVASKSVRCDSKQTNLQQIYDIYKYRLIRSVLMAMTSSMTFYGGSTRERLLCESGRS
jgi:hypothetical protein